MMVENIKHQLGVGWKSDLFGERGSSEPVIGDDKENTYQMHSIGFTYRPLRRVTCQPLTFPSTPKR